MRESDSEVAPGEPAESSHDRTAALIAEYRRTGDLAIRNRIVESHERLVRYVASKFAGSSGEALEDLVQVGYIGLIGAIERYDPSHGASFATFAMPTIMGEIKRHFRDHTWGLKAPRRLRELGLSLRKIRERLEVRLGRPPTVAEMAEEAGVSEERLLEAMELDRVYQPTSLDAPMTDDGGDSGSSFWEAIGKIDPELEGVEQRAALQHAVSCLDPRARDILYYRFYEELSQSQVAERMGVSQMHISRLERQALARLRSILE